MVEEEERLVGGYVNCVSRSGDTVRRTAGPWSATTQRLLAHVRACGVGWAPEPLGFDQQGREVWSFLAGVVPHAMPEWIWREAVLLDVARALRHWHDATASFERAGAIWGGEAREPGEVICHNDFAPYNCVFEQQRFRGAFDFDTCAPGPRLADLAYTAYRFVPVMPPRDAAVEDGAQERSPFSGAELRARLAAFLEEYSRSGMRLEIDPSALLEAVAERLQGFARWTENHCARTGELALVNHARMYRAHSAWLRALLLAE